MVVIAVAGGTGALGRTIVESLITKGTNEVKILARKSNPTLEKELGVSILVVDYADVAATTRILEENNVHTVISTINMLPSDGSTPEEVELIQAADASKTTKRFIPSDFGILHTNDNDNRFPATANKAVSRAALEKATTLEHTRIFCGYFIDYYLMPKVKSYLMPFVSVIDIDAKIAAIPGSGNTPVVFTHTVDVASLTAELVDLPKWDPETYVIGDKVTWNEFVALLEDAIGTKFQVTYDSVDTLKAGKITELPNQTGIYQFFPKELFQGMLAIFGLWYEDGSFDMKPARTLNEQVPGVKVKTAKEYIDLAWRK